MPPPRSRRSTSAATYTDSEAAELQRQLNTLRLPTEGIDASKVIEDAENKTTATHCIRQIFLEDEVPNRMKDAFRHVNGFQAILDSLRTASTSLASTDNAEQTQAFLNLLHNILSLLSTALQEHWGNRKFFRKKVEDGGWNVVERTLKKLVHDSSKTYGGGKDIRERLLGYLIACGLEDDTLSDLFLKLRRLSEFEKGSAPENEGKEEATGVSAQKSDPHASASAVISKALGPQAYIYNPEVIPIALELWLVSNTISRPTVQNDDAVVVYLPTVLRQVAELSTHSLIAVHETGALSKILRLFVDPSLEARETIEFRLLATALLKLGLTDLNDAFFLYQHATSSTAVARLLRQALDDSYTPPYVHFDLSLYGYASIELPDLGRSFPPLSSTSGYTLSLWLQIVHFDPQSHTTIFGAFDSSQTCFVLVYLEKDTRNLILQTSVTSSKPSVRFKSFVFEPLRWYHLCIVHRRPKVVFSSKASLFIDGEFVEQVKAHYPSAPPPASSGKENVDVVSPGRKHKPVQTFLGTPQDLATKLGRGVVHSQWRLASAYLFNDTLSDDLIAVHKQLGPRYFGNYQDCLGSFQTYEASAALNLRNESLHPGKEDRSDIMVAIRSKASGLLPESKFLLNISPTMVLDDNDRNNIDETQLIRSLSKNSAKNLRNVSRGGRIAIAINGAVPSVNEALLHNYGIAVLTGDPAVVVPQSLDDASWRVGGCAPVGLALVEAAHSRKDLLLSLNILFSSVKDSWRNSEAMERENGFGVLASLLTAKLGYASPIVTAPNLLAAALNERDRDELALEVLYLILEFVGYHKTALEDSVINNPLAYRILLVDLDIWRSSSEDVQRLYYGQFTTFGTGSKHHMFNAKRLARMRIIKKWLDALKTDIFYLDTFGYFITAFESLLKGTISADSLRSLALYITYAVYKTKPNQRSSQSVRRSPQSAAARVRHSSIATSPGEGNSPGGAVKAMTSPEIGSKILKMYTELLCQKDTANIKKFARTVTNKWLLHLLADDDPTVVILTVKILARVLVTNGSGYVEKFSDKTGGFVIMKYRLRRWWNITTLWPICFAILFGKDVANIDFNRPFDLYGLLAIFPPGESTRVVNPAILPVIMAMLQNGLKSVVKDQDDPTSPAFHHEAAESSLPLSPHLNPVHNRKRSMSLQVELGSLRQERSAVDKLAESAKTMQTVTRFLADMHSNSQDFRDFAINTPYVQELLFLLFPVIVSSDIVSPETELHSKDSSLTFNGNDVIIRPLSQNSTRTAPIVRTASAEPPSSPKASKAQPLKRGSSYILVTSEDSKYQPSSAKLHPILSPKEKPKVALTVSHSIVEEVLEIIIAVFSDQIFSRKDFPGIGLYMKVPPGFQEHQAYFESFILRNAVSSIANHLQLNQKVLWEPRALTNLGRFATHLGEAVYEGWFFDGAEVVLDFLGGLLEYLQRSDIQSMKSVRLCSEIVVAMRTVVSRLVLLRLSEVDDSHDDADTCALLKKITYWQTILFTPDSVQEEFVKLFCYLLYTKLRSHSEQVKDAAANLWRILLVQKPQEVMSVLHRMMDDEKEIDRMSRGFEKILELDNLTFLKWIDERRDALDAIFFGRIASVWEEFVRAENRRTEDTAKTRTYKRREKLKVWVSENLNKEDIIHRHEISSDHWRSNIYASENVKRQRSTQDLQDGLSFNLSTWGNMVQQLHRPCGLFDNGAPRKWQLDQTEGRNRMRMRMIPDREAHLYNYQAKATRTSKPAKPALDLQQKTLLRAATMPIAPSPTIGSSPSSAITTGTVTPSDLTDMTTPNVADDKPEVDDGYEMVEEPMGDGENYEDKNRKVMRSLQRGDQVENVHNIARIVGLEACEGLLIVGKKALYLLDNLFQRSDGEIVDVWQAPQDERDTYLQMISGREAGERALQPTTAGNDSRSWHWEDVLSVSKRRFLFRDVGIEVFFVDGQSYLLTISTPKLRDELHQKLLTKAPHVAGAVTSTSMEDLWRIESLRTPEDNPQTFGSRLTNVFAHSTSNPSTKKWIKGEISNFHYLMLVNTMAGRTFNDLTQYPVFPWVLADYTSGELDLTNPRSFRDLTKPMGCQNPERQAEFRDRYQSFAEMGDHNAPPFHYGTHYSSAMIVTSFLIRLQPFVQSYLLLQGGNFDHPDRLFYSVEKAWASASRDNMTDVRELIPEFYYLPEFLQNANGYDFGSRQGNAGTIDNVALPPWAKGDPKIFIAKHREALESDHVSKHLHQWIDLVFGHKQRGEAALEATNVFHHLSYRGAKNLDEIDDPVERLATIGIIHNFGQTPHQVFQRAHPGRDDLKQRLKKLDTLADTLTRLPFPLLESPDHITSLLFSHKDDKLLCSGPFRLNIPPNYDRYMEWGFVDGSVRFHASESKKLVGLFEHMHQGQLSCAMFADSRTLITAGTDCTISVWTALSTSKAIDLSPKACLFGHRTAVTTFAISRSFSTLLSASSDGQVLLWDLNRLDLLRIVTEGTPIECACINDVTGVIMLCRGPDVTLFSLNGDPMLEQHVCVEGDEAVTSCAFYEGVGNEHLERNLIFTGHKRGVVNIWNLIIVDGSFVLEHVKRMHHMDTAGFNVNAAITCILPLALVVYTGDDDGRVYEWDAIQRHA